MPKWTLTTDDQQTAELRDFVRAGRLFDVQAWIADRKPVFVPSSRKQQPLQIAVDKGFHSMVDILASVWPDQESLSAAANRAAEKRRTDLVWLLLEKGVDIKAVELCSVAECNDKELMKHFLDRWEVVGSNTALTYLLLGMPRPLIGLIREYRDRIPDYDRQLAAALKEFIRENHPKWIALALWMGADPRLPVPDLRYPSDDPADWTTALDTALWADSAEPLKMLKPLAEKDDLNGMLQTATHFLRNRREVIEYLLECGADINNKPNGGSSILDGLFRPDWMPVRTYGGAGFKYGNMEAMKRWIDRGARWVPDDRDSYRECRVALQELDCREAWKFIGFLTNTVDEETLITLCDTPKLRSLLEAKGKALRERIHAFNVRREEAEERRQFYPRKPTEIVFKQRPSWPLGVKTTYTDRQDLYRAVWSQPLSELTHEYCMDPEVLGRICSENNIPRPRVGHWQKAEARVAKPALTLPEPEENTEIVLKSYGKLPEIESDSLRSDVDRILRQLSKPNMTVHVEREASRHHPMVIRHRELRRLVGLAPENNPNTGSVSTENGLLNIDVRVDMEKRAERVMSALINLLEDVGITVNPVTSDRGFTHTEINMYGGKGSIAIDQECGRMRLRLFVSRGRYRRAWGDGRRQLVEECLAQLAAMATYGLAIDGGRKGKEE